jgi:FMN phosphatase YigB (HAD superfamily)
MIGDRTTDLEPARRLGLRTCLIANDPVDFQPSLRYATATEIVVSAFLATTPPPPLGY